MDQKLCISQDLRGFFLQLVQAFYFMSCFHQVVHLRVFSKLLDSRTQFLWLAVIVVLQRSGQHEGTGFSSEWHPCISLTLNKNRNASLSSSFKLIWRNAFSMCPSNRYGDMRALTRMSHKRGCKGRPVCMQSFTLFAR